MKKSFQILFIAAVLFLSILSAPLIAAEKEKSILLKTPACFPLGLPGVNTSLTWVGDNLEQMSGNTLKMKVYEPGKLVAPLQVLGSVSKGAVNAGFSISGYWEGMIPGSSIFSSIPFGPEAPEFLAWMYSGNGRTLYQKMYDDAGFNVHVIPLGLFCPESAGWFVKPMNKTEDLKGLNIRFYGLGGKVLQKAGASVSLIPGGEIFPSLEKGVIDATEFSMPAIDAMMGFHKIAKYNYYPGWHQQATFFELLINKDTWNDMSPRQQNTLEILCRAATLNTLAFTESIQAKAMSVSKEKHGVTIDFLSQEILATLESAWAEVATDLSGKSPMFKEAWEDLSAFRKEYKIWGDHGFLSRAKKSE
ncbi:MAG: TRAP transporter substrate-binding protein [Proteobacteria bacterium]|nr:TRAP transporter substrate-binding protein [Pseudomonadota bacterium]